MLVASAPTHHEPLYVTLVVLHVIVAVVGFGSVAISGAYGRSAAGTARQGSLEELRRYFSSSGRAEWAVVAVPFFGAAAVGARSGPSQFRDAWVPAALAVWAIAAGVLIFVVRPAERRIRAALVDAATTEPAEEQSDRSLAAAGRDLTRGAAVSDVAFAVALLLMVFRP